MARHCYARARQRHFRPTAAAPDCVRRQGASPLDVPRDALLAHQVFRSRGNSATRRLFESGKSRFHGLDTESALELLAILNAAERLDHISPLKSVGLHPLKGNRRGQWAITVNGPWRICFRFKGGDAYDVEIVDYH